MVDELICEDRIQRQHTALVSLDQEMLDVTCVTYNCSRRRTPVIGENVTEIGLRVG